MNSKKDQSKIIEQLRTSEKSIRQINIDDRKIIDNLKKKLYFWQLTAKNKSINLEKFCELTSGSYESDMVCLINTILVMTKDSVLNDESINSIIFRTMSQYNIHFFIERNHLSALRLAMMSAIDDFTGWSMALSSEHIS
ncbi:MAG: hypothetical protein WCJ36_03230 [Candidatus Saccharibacteria bacterium]